MKKQTEKKILKEIIQIIATSFKPKAIYFFGSRVWDQTKVTPSSDIDIFVILEKLSKKNWELMVEANTHLKNIKLPIDIIFRSEDDFLNCKDIPGSIESLVSKKGKRVL